MQLVAPQSGSDHAFNTIIWGMSVSSSLSNPFPQEKAGQRLTGHEQISIGFLETTGCDNYFRETLQIIWNCLSGIKHVDLNSSKIIGNIRPVLWQRANKRE